MKDDRWIIRVGIVVILATAAFAAWCSAQPGYRVARTDASPCFDDCGPPETSDVVTRPAGSTRLAVAIVLTALPGLLVLGHPTRRALLTWSVVIASGFVLYMLARTAVHDRDGWVSSTRVETLWPRVALVYATIAVLTLPVILAGALYVSDYVRRRRSA